MTSHTMTYDELVDLVSRIITDGDRTVRARAVDIIHNVGRHIAYQMPHVHAPDFDDWEEDDREDAFEDWTYQVGCALFGAGYND